MCHFQRKRHACNVVHVAAWPLVSVLPCGLAAATEVIYAEYPLGRRAGACVAHSGGQLAGVQECHFQCQHTAHQSCWLQCAGCMSKQAPPQPCLRPQVRCVAYAKGPRDASAIAEIAALQATLVCGRCKPASMLPVLAASACCQYGEQTSAFDADRWVPQDRSCECVLVACCAEQYNERFNTQDAFTCNHFCAAVELTVSQQYVQLPC